MYANLPPAILSESKGVRPQIYRVRFRVFRAISRLSRFKYKQLKELLLSIQHLDLLDQEDIVKQKFTNWKGNLEQVDDVCLIGIRI